ncbi:MAG: iron-containing alcohol dehydrogenase [Blastocatellia bacterium]|nr:iron-containing alcohol dehydrogenase [Blastocatellia bacterium]MBN8724097.1 iron-containing alcohol dehydrogenase [Acidobacteriota bacterium]
MGFINRNEVFDRGEFTFFVPTQIKYGMGKVSALALEVQVEDDLSTCTNVMIMTDKGVLGAGLIEKVKNGLNDSAYEIKSIFDEIPADSDLKIVEKCAQEIKNLEINLIIAVGGGSVMDTAKLASLLGTYGGEVRDYEGGFMVPGKCIPIIAIPTTVGTGSEVSVGAVVKDHENKTKLTIASPHLYPRMAMLDPEMVATLPAKLVAYTGMDALTHAIEAYVSTENQPISEALALKAAEMIYDNLETAVKDPSNVDARAKMQIAAMIAGMAFSNAPVGATHAISHTIGGLYGLHHGLSNAIALPYVMEFNLEHSPSRYAALARAFDVSETGLSDIELGKRAIEQIRKLKASLDIPEKYRDLAVPADEETVAKVTEIALMDICMAFNPRKAEFDEFQPLIQQVI